MGEGIRGEGIREEDKRTALELKQYIKELKEELRPDSRAKLRDQLDAKIYIKEMNKPKE